MKSCLTFILLSSIVTVTTAGNVRLVGGINSCAGRLEVYYNGEWGTVCDDYWDKRTASVLCRELGCDSNPDTIHLAYFGPGSGKILMDNLICVGSESTILSCRRSLKPNCKHNEDVGVICSGVRLVGGSRCSGRLEIPRENTWMSACKAAFDQKDAEVVCREMGCGPPVQLLGADTFCKGEGQVWTQESQCKGNEYQFDLCPTSPSHINCSHENDVGIVCADTLRIVGVGSHCAGRVEVHHDGRWGTVRDAGWDLRDAAVVCRQLGCGEAVKAPKRAHFGEGKGPIWLSYVHCTGQESALTDCRANGWGKHGDKHAYDAGVICSAIRLVGGTRCSGRVEMLRGNNTWVSVCDAAFDQKDAEVVCRELNCGVPVQLLGADTFGKGEGQVWTQEIQCTGEESHISLCPSTPSFKDNCTHENDVGLICSGYKALKLVDGPDICSGRVERQYFSKWGSVCDECMNMRAANVLCRELNCGIAVSVVGVDWFGEGSGEIWADVFDCQGNETKLSECSISSWSRAESSHKQDVGVICSNSSLSLHYGRVRLSGERECEGEVEVYIHQVWRRVLLDSWSLTESSVVCRQLGCGSVLNFTNSSSSSDEHSYECVMGFQCSGTEDHLRNCSSPQTLNCSATQQLTITCLGQNYNICQRSIRLVGSGGDCAGRLEVFHKGSWGTVCDDFWDIKDAHVVCRQLQCGVALSNQPVPVWFGSGSGPIWLDDVNCEGNETSLWSCSSRVWGDHDCKHKEDVGVMCSEFKELRLTEGCEGNVEVLYNGSWGNVCNNQMESDTANLICQELNCGRSGQLSYSTSRVPSAHNWLDNVECRPHDLNLWQCPTSPWGQNFCSKNEVAHITCSDVIHEDPQTHLTCSNSPSPHRRQCSNHLPLRLSGGKGLCSGRLEVYHNSVWGSVCDDLWDIRDAQVVCRQLGCGAALSVDGNEAFGAGEGVVWMNRVECRGTEIHLWDCPHVLKNHTDCSHKEQVRLICADLNVRLVNGSSRCSGNVEVLYDGQWGTVCQDDWDLTDAEVVCREVGCGEADDVLYWSHFGGGSGPIWMDNVNCSGTEPTLMNCSSNGWGVSDCDHDEDAGVICSETINYGRFTRLVSGPHLCSGRVELLRGNIWTSVCGAVFDDQDAEVVCRELNCGVPVQLLGADTFGKGEGQVWTQEIQCRGNESLIRSCSSSTITQVTCSHHNDVGLKCSGFSDLRLMNGSDICSGRVERQYFSKWGSVCDECMNMRAANVLCRELNCGIAVSVVGVDWFGEGSGEIWADVFDCQGNETKLSECSISSWSRAESSHKQDVGVICSNSSLSLHDGRVRLSGERECEGEVEVYIHQVWRRVLLDSWSLTESSVVCRQLGCGSVLNFTNSSSSSDEHSYECVMGFQCSGTEDHLRNCSSPQTLNCSATQQLSITCQSQQSIRLVGSGRDCAGRLEVFHKGSWGTVCDDFWDIKDAHVVCRQLQCGVALSNQPVPAWFGPGSGPIWLDDVNCEGNETSLWSCSSRVWGDHDCNHKEDVGVVCSGKQFIEYEWLLYDNQRKCSNHLPLRLSGGKGLCSGRLEVYHNSVWGSVCDDLWDIRDAQVVCRQLGCGAALSVDGNEAFGAGEGVVWMNRVECRGTEIHLWDCPHVLKNHTDCSHKEQVRLICAVTDLSVTTTSATTTSASPSVFHTKRRAVRWTTVTPPQTPPAASLFIPPVVVIVLGVLLLLLLVLLLLLLLSLLIMIKNNRVMKRGTEIHTSYTDLFKRRHWAQTEAVYEEIDHRHTNRESQFTQRVSLISEEQHSGYEVADELLSG
ncbi:scavenger receptor cysteine-rich type 1 protein M130-like [Misgurnus anguillicaudatus]|uniref:scavenger receptor cysteine-rich type 1 protein M130-like n=1 Tax=Misgurnus anguillicaudatus TaxID=75329 RepID=UPI003CCF51F8